MISKLQKKNLKETHLNCKYVNMVRKYQQFHGINTYSHNIDEVPDVYIYSDLCFNLYVKTEP